MRAQWYSARQPTLGTLAGLKALREAAAKMSRRETFYVAASRRLDFAAPAFVLGVASQRWLPSLLRGFRCEYRMLSKTNAQLYHLLGKLV